MTLTLLAVSFDSPAPEATGEFWAGLLGRTIVEEPEGVLVPGDSTQVGLRFVRSVTTGSGRNRLHLHVTSSTADEQSALVETALALGGTQRGAHPPPPGRILYFYDPDGNEFCLIEPGNRYLADSGRLGEVTCDGSMAGARYWREALGWSVVWDQDDQLAIQSSAGGTKLAWDEWHDDTVTAPERQRFDLVASEPAMQVERLVALGATRLSQRDGVITLSDPDGNPFTVSGSEPG